MNGSRNTGNSLSASHRPTDGGDGAGFLLRASQALASSLDYETTLSTTARLAIPGFADWSAVHLADGGGVQRVAMAHRDSGCEILLRDWQRSRPFRTDIAGGVPEVIRTGRALFLPVVDADALHAIAPFADAVDLCTQVGFASLIVVPLTVETRTLGTLMFVRDAARSPFLDADLSLAETLGRQAALAVDHAILYEALKRREQLYHLTFDRAPVGIAHVGLDGRILHANDRMAVLFGCAPNELAGTPICDLRRPGAPPRDLEARDRLLSGASERVTFEEAYRRGDGSTLAASVTVSLVRGTGGEPVHLLAVVEDLSALRQAEEALQASEDRLRLALHAVGVGIWERDIESGRVRWTATAEAGLIPTAEFESDRQALLALVHPEDRRTVADGVSQAIEDGRPFDLGFRIVAADGGVRWMQTRGRALCDASGVPRRVFGVAVDVTDRKELEQQFIHAQKLEAVGRLAGGIAHDFNNILAAIMGYAEVVLEDLPTGSPVRDDVQEISRAAERAAALTRQLLTFSRRQVARPQAMNVNESLEKMRRLVTRLVGEDVLVEFRLGGFAECVRMDPGQFEQVVMNLIVNARDAMPGGGHLILATGVEAKTGRGGWGPGRRDVVLSVTDTGTGMDEATRRKIFEPFFTTKGQQGTGLGLSTVYGIVEQSGGGISVASAPGEGCTFTIRLPIVELAQQGGMDDRLADSSAA